MAEKYAPKRDERARDLFERADMAGNEERSFNHQQLKEYNLKIHADIAKINKHSYKTRQQELRNLAQYEYTRYKG